MVERRHLRRNRRRGSSTRTLSRTLRFEPLEERQLLAILTVNSTLDNTIAGDGLTTLREAITTANSNGITNEIQFALGGAGPHTIVLSMGQLVVNSDLTITGPGRDLLTIDASGSDSRPDENNGTGTRVFDIALRPVIGWNVTLRGMTITGGDISGRGGAIQAAGNLTIADVRIVDNHAANHGGAIYTTWRLTITNDSVIENNSTLSFGGGVYADTSSPVSLNESIISGNSAVNGGAGMFVDTPSFDIDDSRIENNRTPAGLFFRGGGLYARDTNVSATNLVLAGNEAGAGGGVFSLRSRLTFITSQIETNKALSEDGGGIYIDATTAGVTLNNSSMTGNTSAGDGGAIYARTSTATVNDSTIADNEATQRGGGIMVRTQHLRVERSRVTGNTAGSRGGGLASYSTTSSSGSLYVADSTIDKNSSGLDGGGIYAYRVFSPSITRSTLNDNEAAIGGGAISVHDLQSNILGVQQSTISGNRAGSAGGAIKSFASRVSLTNSTVTGNEITNPQTEWGGGGVIAYFGSPIGVHHTILAGNHDPSALGPDLRLVPGSGSTLSASYSLFGDNRGTGRTETGVGATDAAGNRFGGLANGPIDPNLGPLTANGGPTMTHALLVGSPALDAGDTNAVAGENFVPEFDQRGTPFTRVADGDAVPGERIDIGAFERQLNEVFHLLVDTLVDEDDDDFAPGDFSLREAIALANANPGSDTISFAPALTATGPATILLEHDELKITDSLTVNGPGASLLTIDASGNDPTPDSTLDDGINNNDGDGSRIFEIDDGNTAKLTNVTLVGLRLTGGDVPSGGAIRFIHRDESLSLDDMVVEANIGRDFGGGVLAQLAGGTTTSSAVITIVNSTIRNNIARGNGGGLHVDRASAIVSNTLVENNRTYLETENGMGGGILLWANAAHSLTIQDSILRGNSAPLSSGGAVRVRTRSGIPGDFPRLTITNSTFVENAAWAGGGMSASGAVTKIIGSTFAFNTAGFDELHQVINSRGFGGGMESLGGGTLEVVNSTISHNRVMGQTDGEGGGIWLAGNQNRIAHSTIAYNTSSHEGGGIFKGTGVPLTFEHSILAENDAPMFPDVSFGLQPFYSLIGNISQAPTQTEATSFSPDANGNLIGNATIGAINPRLGPLVFNGGPTMTHALLSVSPALDAGNPAAVAGTNGVPEFDQRGLPRRRIVDGDEAGGPRIDMGAVERQANPLAGDYNFNGVVDAADYVVWRKTLDSANDFRADGNGDSDVDDADYVVWRSNFGNVWTPPTGAVVSATGQTSALLEPGPAVQPGVVELVELTEPTMRRRAVGSPLVGEHSALVDVLRGGDALLAWLAASGNRRHLSEPDDDSTRRDLSDKVALDAIDEALETAVGAW